MLVKALRLRDREIKLTADELRLQTPMIGRLQYQANAYGGRDGRGALTCLLMPYDAAKTEPLIQLYRAQIRRIDHRGILIRGEEDEWRRKERTSYAQTLWCWPFEGTRLTMIQPNSYANSGTTTMS